MSDRSFAADDLTFEAPGPGTWHLLDAHFPRPLTRYKCSISSDQMERPYNEAAARYGTLVERETAVVNRFYYMKQRIIRPDESAEHGSGGPHGVPYDTRIERLAETFERKGWRDAVESWDTEMRPGVRTAGLELVAENPDDLDDDALIDHLEACRQVVHEATAHHFRVLPPMGLCVGDFLAHAADWIGRQEAELLTLLDGATPASAGLVEELSAVTTAIDADESARAVLFSDAPPGTIIDRLENHAGPVGAAMGDWLDIAGYRMISGYTYTDHYALEQPAVLVRTLRSALESGADLSPADDEPDRASVRAAVPAAHRDEFDTMLSEARSIYRVRDESSLLAQWAKGLLRRGLLAAGRRLADREQLRDPEHVVEMTHEEVLGALRGESTVSAEEVAAHVTYRLTHDRGDAPETLGPAPSPPEEDTDEPDPAARARTARLATRKARLPEIATEATEQTVQGHAASEGTYEGVARVVSGPEDFSKIEDGDVLVAEATSSAFNVVLPLLGGIVTDTGGMLSHPAIVAREFGIPAVVGCEDATDRIRDGTPITVNGEEGTVRLMAGPDEGGSVETG